MQAPSCIGPQNWRIGKLYVLAAYYGAARDKADEFEAVRYWILVLDGHVLDGQVYGREEAR